MAALNPPPLFKKIVPYLKRAEEVSRHKEAGLGGGNDY
jgi:hypothetical protein